MFYCIYTCSPGSHCAPAIFFGGSYYYQEQMLEPNMCSLGVENKQRNPGVMPPSCIQVDQLWIRMEMVQHLQQGP